MNIGEKIKFLRQEKNMTQKELADKLHVSSQAVSNWELHKGFPDISNLIRISDMFDISLDELIKEDTDLKENLMNGRIEKNITITLSALATLVFIAILAINIYKVAKSNFSDWHIMGLFVGLMGLIYFSRELLRNVSK